MGVSDLAESSAERIVLVLPPADRVSGGVKSAHNGEREHDRYQQDCYGGEHGFHQRLPSSERMMAPFSSFRNEEM